MTRNIDGLTRRGNPYGDADALNHEGFPAYRRSPREQYLLVLLTNTLGGSFYASEDQLRADTLEVHRRIIQLEAMYAAKAIVYARREGLMRLQPIVGLAVLARRERDLFHLIFNRVIQTPGDLADFIELMRGGVVGEGLGRSIKRAAAGWLNQLSEYHAIKYNQGGQGYSLRDILRVVHPKPGSQKQEAIFLWLADRDRWRASELRRLTPQIEAFEALKIAGADGDIGQARDLIRAGRLPYEVVTGAIRPDPALWADLMNQMPYLALLRHLNTLQRVGVFQDRVSAEYAAKKLGDPEARKAAKVLPFRLYTAFQEFNLGGRDDSGPLLVRGALMRALEESYGALPGLGERVAIAPDVSGSMAGRLTKQGVTRYIDVAALFSAALIKAAPGALVLPFHVEVVGVTVDAAAPLMQIARELSQLPGGGTALSAPISELLARRQPVDSFIGITDSMEWAADVHGNQGFLPTWREYRRRVAPSAQGFLIQLAPYRMGVAPQEEPGVHYLYGWSDSVLRYMAMQVQGMESQVGAVEGIQL